MELIDSAAAEFERVVRQLPADSWDRPTPSDFWVHELVEQILVRNCFTAPLLAGDQLGHDLVIAVVELGRGQVKAFAAAPPDQIVAGPVKLVVHRGVSWSRWFPVPIRSAG